MTAARRTHAGAFAGGLASRVAPSMVRLLVLYLVQHYGTDADVGRVAVASAASYLCGSLAEMGTMTSLSLPREYFAVDAPPLRASRRLRLGAAAAGSTLYGLLWVAGFGSHEPVFLVALPLPFLVALSLGYAGALNATGALAIEGWITIAESAALLGVTVALLEAVSPVEAALVALTATKALGTAARMAVVSRRPQSDDRAIAGLVRRQTGFLASTGAIVVHGQLDVVVLGFYSFAFAGVYAVLVRTAYFGFLVAEGLTLAMYSTRDEQVRRHPLLRHWRLAGLAIGIAGGGVFLLGAERLLDGFVDRDVSVLAVPILLFALLIPVRFYGYVVSVDIVRAARQVARIPPLVLGSVLLLVGAIAGGETGSVTWLSAFRLASEAAVTAGFLLVAQRLPPVSPSLQPRVARVE